MAVNSASSDFDVEQVEYLRHGETPLLASVYRPRGPGPFPAAIACHGGAWCMADRLADTWWYERLASEGLVVIAPDFRSGHTDPYPASLQDINYAVRWTKSHAEELKTRPDLIGFDGRSTGGHQAMLVAMRPNDPRYGAIPLPPGAAPQDASVRWVAMTCPVINPLSRYHYAQRMVVDYPHWENLVAMHDSFWGSEAAMAEGNPVLALERGEALVLPPAIWLQPNDDPVHDYKDERSDFPGNEPQRFVTRYREAGGAIALEYLDLKAGPGVTPPPSQVGDLAALFLAFLARQDAPAR